VVAMGRKAISQIIGDLARSTQAGANRAYDEHRLSSESLDLATSLATRLFALADEVAVSPVDADQDGLFADLAGRLEHTATGMEHKVRDSVADYRVKAAVQRERDRIANEIRGILKDYTGEP
jgi:hypothetical protein